MQAIFCQQQMRVNRLLCIALMSAMVTALGLSPAAQAQLKDDFSNPDWKKRWEIHDDGAEGAPSQWSIGPAGGIPDGAFERHVADEDRAYWERYLSQLERTPTFVIAEAGRSR